MKGMYIISPSSSTHPEGPQKNKVSLAAAAAAAFPLQLSSFFLSACAFVLMAWLPLYSSFKGWKQMIADGWHDSALNGNADWFQYQAI